jgi:hypothetical protein
MDKRLAAVIGAVFAFLVIAAVMFFAVPFKYTVLEYDDVTPYSQMAIVDEKNCQNSTCFCVHNNFLGICDRCECWSGNIPARIEIKMEDTWYNILRK